MPMVSRCSQVSHMRPRAYFFFAFFDESGTSSSELSSSGGGAFFFAGAGLLSAFLAAGFFFASNSSCESEHRNHELSPLSTCHHAAGAAMALRTSLESSCGMEAFFGGAFLAAGFFFGFSKSSSSLACPHTPNGSNARNHQ